MDIELMMMIPNLDASATAVAAVAAVTAAVAMGILFIPHVRQNMSSFPFVVVVPPSNRRKRGTSLCMIYIWAYKKSNRVDIRTHTHSHTHTARLNIQYAYIIQ